MNEFLSITPVVLLFDTRMQDFYSYWADDSNRYKEVNITANQFVFQVFIYTHNSTAGYSKF